MATPDAEAIKQREHATWTATAPGWRKHDGLISTGVAPVAERMLELAGVGMGTRLLDLASGTGEPALTAAKRVGGTGFVLGTDLVDDMLAFAREKAQRDGLSNVEFRCVDAEALVVEADSFDALTCRWGIMFMPDPVAALRRARNSLREGGRVTVATWAEPARNPFAALPLSIIREYIDVPAPLPNAPGIFAFADPTRLRATLEQAGFSEIELEELSVDMVEVDSGPAYWEVMSDLAGPITALIRQLPEDTQAEVVRKIGEAAEGLRKGDKVVVGGVTWIASARR